MDDMTTVKVRKSTVALIKRIGVLRGRRETQEQIILELIDRYLKEENA